MKQLIKNVITQAATRRGYHLIPDWKIAGHPLAIHLRALFIRYEVDCVLDVGGNMGQYHDFLRDDVRFQGTILTFEPVRRYVELLQSRAQHDENWKIFPHALGATESTAQINVTKSPGLNSFLQPRSDMVSDYWDSGSVTATEIVRIRALDDMFEGLRRDFGFSRPYLKLDTQGFDLEVLNGSTSSLPAIRALQTEASIRPIYQGMPTYQQAIDQLTRHGFDLSGMFPVSMDAALRLVEFDCVAVNRAFAH